MRPGGDARRGGVLLIPAFAAFLVVALLLPVFSADAYSIVRHTTSGLGAQGAPGAWLMNLVFASLGLASLHDGWSRLPRGYGFHRAALAVSAAGLLAVAVFQQAPVDGSRDYSVREDELHSLFSGVVGLSFSVFAIAVALAGPGRRLPALGAMSVAVGGSILVFAVPEFAGIWQRVFMPVAFAGLITFARGDGGPITSRATATRGE